jgi:hypothetical protein
MKFILRLIGGNAARLKDRRTVAQEKHKEAKINNKERLKCL